MPKSSISKQSTLWGSLPEGEAFGGVCEEIWAPVSGGTMVGTFKLAVNDAVQFYELMTIVPDSTGPQLRLKHFNADLTGWEEKGEVFSFPFRAAAYRKVEFGGITYERFAEDSLRITVTFTHTDSEPTQEVIICHKR
ncbi:MAG: DUF6265 family protein [Candidatus Zixiibacteriota bacterium]